jgi:hypothetical protein
MNRSGELGTNHGREEAARGRELGVAAAARAREISKMATGRPTAEMAGDDGGQTKRKFWIKA